jgi:hypothetical protein
LFRLGPRRRGEHHEADGHANCVTAANRDTSALE